MNCPGSDRCAIREHKGYVTCDVSGSCLNHPRTAPARRNPTPGREGSDPLPRMGRGAGIFLYLFVVGVSALALLGACA